MILSLEVLQAKHGDCLLLHFGNKTTLKTMVIDGGPAGVYRDHLKPRLLEIKDRRSPDEPLPLSMIMVSHLDDDHINGVLQLLDDIDENGAFDVKHVWANTFDDIIGNIQLPKLDSVPASNTAIAASSLPIPPSTERSISAIIASTGQGRQLRDMASKLSFTINGKFKKLKGKKPLVRGDVGQKPVPWDGLKITVIHPNEQRLIKLQEKWDKDLKAALKKGDLKVIPASLTSKDTSPFNLSSIVCLIEMKKKRILLTGDGRSSDILEGLKMNKLLDSKGKMHVDVIKIPHHGSVRNMEADFLERVTADHYVISADGNHDNPDKKLLDLFGDKVKKGTVYFTNRSGMKNLKQKMDAFGKRLEKKNSKVKIVYKDTDPMIIDLLDNITL
jgi:hypothetical protein